MTGEKKFKEIATLALAEAKKLGASQAEVVLWNGIEELTRFANSTIHQNVALEDTLVHIRIILGKKIGVARGNRLDKEGVKGIVRAALELAKLQRDDPDFENLPQKANYSQVDKYYEEARHLGAQGRAEAIGWLIGEAGEAGLLAAGAFAEGESETMVANSNGVEAYMVGKSASLSTIMTGGKGSGYASQNAKGGGEIDVEEVTQRAVFKATYGELMEVLPGEYEVILEPAAVCELLDFFGWLGPNARIYHEDVSFYKGNLGKRVLSSKLTIWDDPLDGRMYPVGFDYEGFPKKKLTLVEKGVLKHVVYDSYLAAKYHQDNTGHALLAPNTWGPTPTHMVVLPGRESMEEMVGRIKKGLLVTRFWYTRVIEHKQLVLTGMTRDGTFLIENGKIVGRLKNLRYTESVISALSGIRGVGKELVLEGSEGSPALVPALHLAKFRFTGVTEHR